MKRRINQITRLLLAAVLGYFWLTPLTERSGTLFWICLFLFVICVIVLSLSFSSLLRRWRGLGGLVALHIAAQAWLQWQWALWDSPIVLIRNLNVCATLVVLGTLIAMLVSLALLLVFEDASAIALAAAWLGFPLFFILLTSRYGTLERLSNAGVRGSIFWLPPLCLLCFLAVAGTVAFSGHFLLLLIKEISGREFDPGQSEPSAKSLGWNVPPHATQAFPSRNSPSARVPH